MSSLLIAGPLALDDFASAKGLLGGAAGYAAMAAAPLANTQLWSRGGADITPQVRGILERRGVDIAGVSWSGATSRNGQLVAPLLSDLEPTDAGDLTAVLLIGLAGEEWQRALTVIRALPGGDQRTVVVAPYDVDLSDAQVLAEICAAADVLIMPLPRALALTNAVDAFAAGRDLGALGAKCVLLTAGPLGGLIVYRQKATTFHALPIETVEPTGIGPAFAGALAAWLTGAGKDDFRAIKRGCAVASGVASICAQGQGPLKLLAADRKEYLERFNRLRRAAKA
jgi:sugar/nucleoside kinase (ribokinase family)